jgi:hypothetical protein
MKPLVVGRLDFVCAGKCENCESQVQSSEVRPRIQETYPNSHLLFHSKVLGFGVIGWGLPNNHPKTQHILLHLISLLIINIF